MASFLSKRIWRPSWRYEITPLTYITTVVDIRLESNGSQHEQPWPWQRKHQRRGNQNKGISGRGAVERAWRWWNNGEQGIPHQRRYCLERDEVLKMRKSNHRLFARIYTKRPVSIGLIKKRFDFPSPLSASQHRTHQIITIDSSASASLRRDFAQFLKTMQASDRVYPISNPLLSAAFVVVKVNKIQR